TRARNSAGGRPARSPMATPLATGVGGGGGEGTGCQAPELHNTQLAVFSNPALRPETPPKAEAALRYASADVAAGIVAYRNRVRDLIVFQCDASFNCAPQNVANATLEGGTLELEVRAGDTLRR